jgi:transposase
VGSDRAFDAVFGTGSVGRPFRDHRQVAEGIVYRFRTVWRDLPEVFGLWQTLWKRHKRFSADGT